MSSFKNVPLREIITEHNKPHRFHTLHTWDYLLPPTIGSIGDRGYESRKRQQQQQSSSRWWAVEGSYAWVPFRHQPGVWCWV